MGKSLLGLLTYRGPIQQLHPKVFKGRFISSKILGDELAGKEEGINHP